MLDESTQVGIEKSHPVNEAIEAQRVEIESFHALLDFIAPVNQSEAIGLIVKMKRSYYKVESFKDDVYRYSRNTEEGDYSLKLLEDAWRKAIGLDS